MCSGSQNAAVTVNSTIASTTLANGPARLTVVRCRLVIDHVRTYTAPPGSPIPPRAMKSTGMPRDSSGFEYFSGLSVR